MLNYNDLYIVQHYMKRLKTTLNHIIGRATVGT